MLHWPFGNTKRAIAAHHDRDVNKHDNNRDSRKLAAGKSAKRRAGIGNTAYRCGKPMHTNHNIGMEHYQVSLFFCKFAA